mgnify:FL=1
MEDIKLLFASNLSRLRTNAGMKQSELGELLNYSDKTVSKWERADAIPDAYVLVQLAKIFGVTVDYLLSEHFEWAGAKPGKETRPPWMHDVMIVAVSGIWAMAVMTFVIFWILGNLQWIIFVCAVPVSLITILVMNSIWNKGSKNYFIVSALVFSLVALIYVMLLRHNPWQLFLIVIPAEVVVFFSFRIVKKLTGQ